MFFTVDGRSYDLDAWNAEAVTEAIAILGRGSGVDNPVKEARRIWAASFPPDYVSNGEFADKTRYDIFIERTRTRASGVPLSHILGGRDFFAHRFKVNQDVLDPRPETEILVTAALDVPWTNVLDLGTGSGAIAISLLAARDAGFGLATDMSVPALRIAHENAEKLGVADRLELRQGSWYGPVTGEFDLIVSNPPYIALDEMEGLSPEVLHEPRMALTDEGDGLSCYRIITAGAGAHLNVGGWLMVEIGPTQGRAVSQMFKRGGFKNIEIRPDLDGRDRVVVGQKPL